MNEYILNEDNWVYEIKTRTGKRIKKILGIKCPHCGYFAKANNNYEEWSTDAQKHIDDCTPLDTYTLKDQWTKEHFDLYNTIPKIIRDIDGDLFELKWYSHYGYNDLMDEVERNIYSNKSLFQKFKREYDLLTTNQKNLIYYAYEA